MKHPVRKRPLSPYRGRSPAERDRRIRSAVAVIRALLQLGDVLDKTHRKRFLTNCLWQITQAEGHDKYDLRYRSRGARTTLRKECRHEHVYRRKDMVQDLIDHPDQVDSIVAKAIGCVVTKAEHAALDKVDKRSPELDGWKRYELAGIEVFDILDGCRVPYDRLEQ
jgi:hypothetical protein